MYKYLILLLFYLPGILSSPILRGNTTLNIENIPSENVSVKTDREIYIAGENVFFSVNIIDSTENPRSEVCYILLRNNKHIYNKLYVRVDNGTSFGCFYLPDTLQTGYYEIVAFTNYMRNFGEKNYFKKNLMVVNRFDDKLTTLILSDSIFQKVLNPGSQHTVDPLEIFLKKDSFKVREKVHLEINIKDEFLNQINSIVTVTVKESNPYTRYLNSIDKNISLELTKPSENSNDYPKETDGIFLSGIILTKDSIPISNECLYLSTPDSVANLQYTYSSEKGQFQFLLSDYYLGKQLIISTKERRDDGYIIFIDDKFKLNSSFNTPLFSITPELKKYILESQKLVKIQKSYTIKNTQIFAFDSHKLTIPYVYKEANLIIFPSLYTPLNNLMEISINLIPDLKIKAERNIPYPFLFNSITKQFIREPATIFLNGVPIYNLNQLMNWSSAEITKIELCKSLRIKGDIGFPGIISITSSQKTDPSKFVSNSTLYDMGKFADFTYFNPPRYSDKSEHDPIPDFRQLLYWNPGLKLNLTNSIDFFASDWSGEFSIEITGINKKGENFRVNSKLIVYD